MRLQGAARSRKEQRLLVLGGRVPVPALELELELELEPQLAVRMIGHVDEAGLAGH
jgi:hypothetical protein